MIDYCLENFLQQEQERTVDVFHFVQEMRKRRVNMIQTLVSAYKEGLIQEINFDTMRLMLWLFNMKSGSPNGLLKSCSQV